MRCGSLQNRKRDAAALLRTPVVTPKGLATRLKMCRTTLLRAMQAKGVAKGVTGQERLGGEGSGALLGWQVGKAKSV